LVFINPASGRSSPNWIPGEYRNLATLLLENHPALQVLVSVPPGDEQMLEIFASMQRPRYMLLTPPSLDVLMGCIAHADVLVSASTGPMHLAGALKVPTVSLFCPLPACAPSLWRPLGNDAVTLLPPEDYCSTRCPGDPHTCTLKDGIVPDDVVRAILPILEIE
jgi:heptosyltransferase-2